MRVTVKDLSNDLGPNAPNSVLVPEDNDGNGRYYGVGETFDVAADRARILIDLGYLEEAKTATNKKDGGDQ